MSITDYKKIKDKVVALILWNRKKENDAHVYLGKIIVAEHGFEFINEAKGWNITLGEKLPEDIGEVPPALKEMLLNADLTFSMFVTDLPQDSTDEFNPTGMKWHE